MDSILEQTGLLSYLIPGAVVIVSLFLGLIVKWTLLRRISALAEKSKVKFDDVLVKALRSVIVAWFTLAGLRISILFLELTPKQEGIFNKTFILLLVFSIFWFLLRLLTETFLAYSRSIKEKLPAASILKNTFKFVILVVGLLIVLQTLGVSITPLLTTLGIGGLAVALAMQETLSNLFSGFHIVASKRVKTGDYIKLDSGEEGYVVDVTWRDTVLRQLPQNHIIIPNSKLSAAVVINYNKPRKAMNVPIEVGIDYDSDLEKVEKVTLETAKEILFELTGGEENFEPFIRFHTFADSSINFTVHLRCREFFDKFLLQHEFIKRLKKRFDREGIVIPFPIRTIVKRD